MKLTMRERTAYLILSRLDAAPEGLMATELIAHGYVARDMRDAMVCGGYIRAEEFTRPPRSHGIRYSITDKGRLRLKHQRRTLARKPPEPDDDED